MVPGGFVQYVTSSPAKRFLSEPPSIPCTELGAAQLLGWAQGQTPLSHSISGHREGVLQLTVLPLPFTAP